MAVVLSEAAAKQVKELKQAQNLPETAFLRMGVRGGGCSGMSYVLEFDTEKSPHDKEFDIAVDVELLVTEKSPHDKEFDIDGVKVVIDKKSYIYLNGTTLDY